MYYCNPIKSTKEVFMKICTACKFETPVLFAPFNEGEELYCSDCQMEAENEINESNECNLDD